MVEIVYKNWQGKTKNYIIKPLYAWVGMTKWHIGTQLFMKAEKQTTLENQPASKNVRDFAIKDILAVDGVTIAIFHSPDDVAKMILRPNKE